MRKSKENVFEEKNKESLRKIVRTLLDTQIALLEYSISYVGKMRLLAKVCNDNKKYEESTKILNKYKKAIRECEKMKNVITEINKIDVLHSIYANIVSGKEIIWAYVPKIVMKAKWFCTKNGYKEFLRLQKENQVDKEKAN